MIPLFSDVNELKVLKEKVQAVTKSVIENQNVVLKYNLGWFI